MMRSRVAAGLFSAVVLLAGCASSGASGLSDPSEIRRDLGRSSYAMVMEGVEKILVTKNEFSLQRFEENFNTIFFETDWQTRAALASERVDGILQVRTRMVIEGRRSANATFRLRFTAFVESQRDGSQVWERLPVSEEREEMINRILADLDMEIRSGVR